MFLAFKGPILDVLLTLFIVDHVMTGTDFIDILEDRLTWCSHRSHAEQLGKSCLIDLCIYIRMGKERFDFGTEEQSISLFCKEKWFHS